MFFSYPTAPHLAAFILRSESVRRPHLTHRPLSVSDRLRLSDLARHSSIASEAHDSPAKRFSARHLAALGLRDPAGAPAASAAINMQNPLRRSALFER